MAKDCSSHCEYPCNDVAHRIKGDNCTGEFIAQNQQCAACAKKTKHALQEG